MNKIILGVLVMMPIIGFGISRNSESRLRGIVDNVRSIILLTAEQNSNTNYTLEIIEVDYIFVTNASNTIEPRKLKQGDKFLNMVLYNIKNSTIFSRNNKMYHHTAVAEFFGDLLVTGNFIVWHDIFENPFILFNPHKQYNELFPISIYDDQRNLKFTIQNEVKFFKIAEIKLHETILNFYEFFYSEKQEVIFENITIRLDNFTLVFMDNGGLSSINILEIIN
ncbi:MAG: hypothetical protein FWF50_05385 [Defluviitaleaceae bacterium]|nr:hypothetical protein [Defluviitaleaceae bacterium]